MRLLFPFALLASSLAACGGSVAPTSSGDKTATDTTQAGGSSGSPSSSGSGSSSSSGAAGPSTTPLLPAVDANVVRVDLESVYLGAPRSCPGFAGGPSAPAGAKMTYDRATKVATWNTCDAAANKFVDATRTLTEAEAAKIEADLAEIRYTPDVPCDGYDGQITTMTTYASGGVSQLYADRNINCYTDGRRYANVDTAYSDLLALAH